MSDFLTQSAARQQVADRLADAERDRLARDVRLARRAAVIARVEALRAARGTPSGRSRWIRIVAAR